MLLVYVLFNDAVIISCTQRLMTEPSQGPWKEDPVFVLFYFFLEFLRFRILHTSLYTLLLLSTFIHTFVAISA